MVARRGKYRVEIESVHSQVRKVIHLFSYAAQVPAEKIHVAGLFVAERRFTPFAVNPGMAIILTVPVTG